MPDQDLFLRFLVDRKFSVYRRIFFVLALIILLKGGNQEQQYTESTFLWLKFGALLIMLSLVGINMYVLIPRFLFRGKYILYFLSAAIGITTSFLIFLSVRAWLPSIRIKPQPAKPDDLWADLLAYVVVLSILCAATAAIKLFQRSVSDRYRITELENIRVHTELSLLKTNISPHFLFNMLNNTEVLIQTDPLKARLILVKLSDLLRYQLYDSSRKNVLLRAEIRFLDHFLDLEKIRRDYFEFEILQEGTQREVEVPPLLFIPFVENAVKHNIVSEKGAYVKVGFVLSDRQLIFTCSNPIAREPINLPGGFGLLNVKRRLELLYSHQYQLEIVEQQSIYSVTLTLTL